MNDFNKELDRYLAQRKEKDEDFTPREKKILKKVESEIKVIDELEAIDQDDKESLEEVRESLLEKFFGFFRLFERKKKVDEEASVINYIEEENKMLDEDLKEVLKITFKWLEKLSSKEKAIFKNSTDFIKYKSILEKYNLIKTKEKNNANN